MIYKSPLRYPGSKVKLVNHIHKVLLINEKRPKVLVEPFVGGGSVFLNFLKNNWVEKAVIGDKDRLIFAFWKTVFNDPKHLINFVNKVDVSVETFKKYKKIADNKKITNIKILAEACLFLNRTSFSGIIAKGAGPIGGPDQKSEYKVDCRFNPVLLSKKISEISKFKSRVTVLNKDWENTLGYAKKRFKEKEIFVYLDPPFYNKANRLYREYFVTHEHHVSLRDYLAKLKMPWILSYDRATEIGHLYKKFFPGSWAFAYSINSPAKRRETEYFILSGDLERPSKASLEKEIDELN